MPHLHLRLAGTLFLLSTFSAIAQVTAINSPDGKPLSQRVVAYWIDAKLDAAAKTLDARETLEYRNPADHAVTTIPFHLYLNAFRPESTFAQEGHRDGDDLTLNKSEQGSMDVVSITEEGAGDLTPTMRFIAPDDGNQEDHTVMEVTLPKPLGPGEITRLQIAFHDKFPLNGARSGYMRDFIMGAQWFPKVGVMWHNQWNCHQYHHDTEFFADFGTYNVNLTLPQRYVVGATGIQTGEEPHSDGTRTLSFRGEDIHDFAWAASPNFEVTDDTFDNSLGSVKLHLLVLSSHSAQAARHLSVLKQSMQKFDEWYGPYPYKQLTLIDPEPDSEFGGMEYPTLITTGFNWWEPSWDYYGLEATVAHEFGHQYWYGMVATNEFEEPWLDEGINSYSEAKVLGAIYGQSNSAYNARSFFGNDSNKLRYGLLRHADVDPVAREGWKFLDDISYNDIVYGKTATVLNTLESAIGEPALREALRLYFTRYRFTHPTGTDFLNTVQQVAGNTNLEPYFAQAIYGTQVLDYSVASLYSDPAEWWKNSNGEPYLTEVTVRRNGAFVFPVRLEVGFADGSKEETTWDGKDSWARFTWNKPVRAVYAQIDRDQNVLLDVNSFNNSFTLRADRTARYKLTNYWIFTQQLLAQWLSFLV
jgi:hypothetical protein